MRHTHFLIFVCLCSMAKGASKYYDGEDRPYEFGYNIEGNQHRHEKKDENGIITGEFGFITADGVYHVTAYATDENGNFKILFMKNIKIGLPGEPGSKPVPKELQPELPVQTTPRAPPQRPVFRLDPADTRSCSNCLIPKKPGPGPNEVLQGPGESGSLGAEEARGGSGGPGSNGRAPGGVGSSGRVPGGSTLDRTAGGRGIQAPGGGEDPLFRPLSRKIGDSAQSSPGRQPGSQPGGSRGKSSSGAKDPELDVRLGPAPPSKSGSQPGGSEDLQPGSESGGDRIRGGASGGGGRPGQNAPGAVSPGQSGKDSQGRPLGPSPTDLARMGDALMGVLYKFNYTVGYHGHNEQGDTYGVKDGAYHFVGRDGLRRNVDYLANEFGYQPHLVLENAKDEEVPKEATEKEAGLKGYEFKWFYDNKV